MGVIHKQLLAIGFWCAVFAWGVAEGSSIRELSFTAYGTSMTIRYEGPQSASMEKKIVEHFREIEKEGSLFDPASTLARLSSSQTPGTWSISKSLCSLIEKGISFFARSEGKFDMAYKSVRPASISDAHVDCKKGTVTTRAPGVRLDIGGIASGFSADVSAGILKKHGYRTFMIDTGGEILVCGKPKEGPWTVGIQDPFDKTRLLKKLSFDDRRCHALSTSGNYQKVGHIVDPVTGKTAQGAVALTVVTPDTTTADAMSTALFVGNKDEAYIKRMAQSLKLEVYVLRGPDKVLTEYR